MQAGVLIAGNGTVVCVNNGFEKAHRESGNACSRPAFRSSDKKVKQSSQEVEEEDSQHPGNLFTVTQTLVRYRMDQHPNPESKCRDRQQAREHCREQSKNAKHD
jgi:hypothetical protein